MNVIALFVSPTESSGLAPVPDPPDKASVNVGLILSAALATLPDLLELPARSVTLPTNFTLGVSEEARAVPSVRYTSFLLSYATPAAVVPLVPISVEIGVNTVPASVVTSKEAAGAAEISSSNATTIFVASPVPSAVVAAFQ